MEKPSIYNLIILSDSEYGYQAFIDAFYNKKRYYFTTFLDTYDYNTSIYDLVISEISNYERYHGGKK